MLKNNTLGRAVYGWGQSLALPLKNGNLDRIFLKPTLLSKQPDYALPHDQQVSHLATGWGHSLIGTDSKHVYGFGLNQSGQLGLGHSSHKGHGNTMTLASDQALKAVSCGREHSHILVQQGEQSCHLYSFGNNMYGQLGIGKDKYSDPGKLVSSHSPVKCTTDNINSVVCGLDNSVFATENGIYAMGWGADGQLGQGKDDKNIPSKIEKEIGNIEKLSSSTDFTLALTKQGKLWTWGNSEYGQGLQGKKIDRILEPLEINNIQHVVDIAAGGPFSAILTKEGRVFTCGYGGGFETLEPKPINNLDNVIKIYAATDYAAAITDSGKLYTWGLNGPSGRLGLGHLEHAYEPRLVELDRKVHHVSLGTNHAIALCDD